MLLNAEQISDTAQGWWSQTPPGRGGQRRPGAGDGPYHLLVTFKSGLVDSFAVRQALACFPGLAIPHLAQHIGEVRTGRASLHVVPQLVYDVIASSSAGGLLLDPDLDIPPFPAPPTEADMADAFVLAMSLHRRAGVAGELAAVVRVSCEQLGWGQVVELVNAMGKPTWPADDDVAAALQALLTQPASTG